LESGSKVNQGEPNPNGASPEIPLASATVDRMDATASAVDLRPPLPPGQRTRKALRFSDQIRKLHAEGYSLETIRATLQAAGVAVSKSTVQREAARRPSSQPSNQVKDVQREVTPPALSPSVSTFSRAPELPAPPSLRSGKEIAQAFFEAHHSNPLLRKDTR
jgi:hypothetical protein